MAVTEESEGIWRRVFPIPFEVSLHKLPDDQRMSRGDVERAVRDELPGILNWLLSGYAAFRAEGGPNMPERQWRMVDALRAAADPLGEFLASHCEQRTGLRIQTSTFSKAFKAWCEDNDYRAPGARGISTMMAARDFDTVKSNGTRFYVGVDLGDPVVTDAVSAASGVDFE